MFNSYRINDFQRMLLEHFKDNNFPFEKIKLISNFEIQNHKDQNFKDCLKFKTKKKEFFNFKISRIFRIFRI